METAAPSTSLDTNALTLQPASEDIWDAKYRLKNHKGEAVDQNLRETFARVAKALADIETTPALKKKWEKQFLWALDNGAIPAGRILSNAGAQDYKPATSTINCTVSSTLEDSMEGILDALKEAGLTLKAGCGIGYEFSTLRPKGAYVSGAGAHTSGPLSFMDVFDKMCFTVSSAGGRRGAQMGTFDISHPDVFDFIKAKREDGRLRQFNLSLLITDNFIERVKADGDWQLVFPLNENEQERLKLDLNNTQEAIWKPWPLNDDYITNENGLTACRVYQTVKARKLWNAIMASTYDYAEPGFILIDKVNELNNNWFCENIRATNPCGEQPLPPHGSCLLGSINLTKFVNDPFTDNAVFDWKKFKKVTEVFTRLLDNVVEINGLALEQQRNEILTKRRHGMGFLGLGSTMTMLGMKYGDASSVAFTEEVSRQLALEGWRQALELSKEKGAAPIMSTLFDVTQSMLFQRPEMVKDGFKVGDKVEGKVLHTRYSKYMQKLAEEDSDLVQQLEIHGARFSHHSSIAPTGTISLSIANNASNGIEPSFAHKYARNIIRPGKKTKEKVDVLSFELLTLTEINGSEPEELPDYFVSSETITPTEHIAVQAAAQKWVDSSISKTINVPSDFKYKNFKDIYLNAYDSGLKGCTTFRFNPEAFQGVLVKEEDLENTEYEFQLASGKTVKAKGGDLIEYDGETHTAANLYEALKEGYYGKL